MRASDAIGQGIAATQAASLSQVTRAGAEWTHAGIYVGRGMVVDATYRAGVTAQSVWNYCQHRALRVRRLEDPAIPASNVAQIATQARQHIGEPYSVVQAILSKLWPGTAPVPGALYCSTLVGLVVARATGYDLLSDPMHQPLHPGTLAAHPDLTDVMLEWRNF